MRAAPTRLAGPDTPHAAPGANCPRLPTGLPARTIRLPNVHWQLPRRSVRVAPLPPLEWKARELRGAGEAKTASLLPTESTPPPAPARIAGLSAATHHPPPARNPDRAAKVPVGISQTGPRPPRWHCQSWRVPCRTRWADSDARCRASDKSRAATPDRELRAILEHVPGKRNATMFLHCCGSAEPASSARRFGKGQAESRQG